MAAVKADAYGHGIIEVADTLTDADGLAVARIEEALLLRQSGINQRILLLGSYVNTEILALCAHHDIDVVIHNPLAVEELVHASLPKKINVWLKLNSGMYRVGMTRDLFIQAHYQLKRCHHVAQIIHMSHFSDSESEFNRIDEQMAEFDKATTTLDAPASLANSAAIIQYPKTHRDWIRPGIMLYGVNPLPLSANRVELDLQQAMTLSAKIVAINTLPAGKAVGYHGTWRASRDSLIATVGIGYADGYPRHAKNGTPVLVNGQRVPLVGTVSMDLLTIDITDCDQVNIGDEVILWSQQLKVDEVASYCDTIAYDLLTSVSKRVPRVYCPSSAAQSKQQILNFAKAR